MNLSIDQNFFKIYFQEFYDKVLYCKNIALNKDDLNSEDVNNLSDILFNLLKDQETVVSSATNSFVFNIYKELQYLMAGLADEIFLSLNWPVQYKDYWNNHLIEYKIFQTHIAGEQIFTRIDNILSKHEMQNLLIPIYIQILSLGFYGKYRIGYTVDEEPQEISHYKKQLFDVLYNISILENKDEVGLFPETKLYTIVNKNIIRNNTFIKWGMILAGTLFTYVLLSYWMWSIQLNDIYVMIDNILNHKIY